VDTAGQIAKISLFEGLPDRQLRELAAIARVRSYNKGEPVFFEGEEGAGFFVVLAGRVKIFKTSPEGKEQILHMFETGECFGEVAVFTGQGYPANALSESKSSLLFFPRAGFVELVKREPSLALNMLAVLSMRLRRFAGLIENLSLKEVPGRLAAYLLYLGEKEKDPPDARSDVRLDISKGQLASLLGTIPETLSRILNKMNRLEMIRSDGSKITILDREALEELAAGERKLP
jgi:CRP/FNR family transcriptional regulator